MYLVVRYYSPCIRVVEAIARDYTHAVELLEHYGDKYVIEQIWAG
jgi:hypothetical protein